MSIATDSRVYRWAIAKAHSPKAPFWVALLFGLELVLIIPLDAVLMFFCMQSRSRIWLYVGVAATFSVISAAMGYLIGHFFWDLLGQYIVPYLISVSLFETIANHLQVHEWIAVFFGALIPFPLKALSFAAGVFHLEFASFVAAVAVARTFRFVAIGGAMALWGEKVQAFVEKHFYRILVVIGTKLALILGFFWAALAWG